ncbi:heterokaryon incompatibility protein-domain-containing protein [Bisporella sp. PMI_857]|nr:heterokaryon incompatibility protein-domain-containing protein [Bisporella sp. PMI_857]
MESKATLCEFCSAINFNLLRVPTAGQLRRLSASLDITGQYPFKRNLEGSQTEWELGPMKRIQSSADLCNLCRAISQVYDDTNVYNAAEGLDPDMLCTVGLGFRGYFAPENISSVSPAVLENMGFGVEQAQDLLFTFRSLTIKWTDNFTESHTFFPKTIWAKHALHEYDTRHSKVPLPLFNDEEIPDDGRLLSGRIASPQVQFNMLRAWIDECTSRHEDHCGTVFSSRFVHHQIEFQDVNFELSKIRAFRLIDVKLRAVERFDNVNIADMKYLALSYVWGFAQRLVINRHNMKKLGIAGSLSGAVSKTIEDAMHLTEMLGIQYLWVDALCILQDDALDKSHHLSYMGEIYKHALFTIVAASGIDAESGLSGVREPRMFRQQIVKVKDSTTESSEIQLVTAQTVRSLWQTDYLFGTNWSTRGWTLQERALSRRALIFTDTQVYWSCREATWTEDIFAETNMTKRKLKFYDFDIGSGFIGVSSKATEAAEFDNDGEKAWDDLRVQISEFSSRHFTGHDWKNFLWAIPVTRFELGLCWNRHAQIKNGGSRGSPLARREGLTTLPMTTLDCRVQFPSWSWIGWMGSVEMRFTNQYRETGMREEIVCYVLRNSPLRVVRISRTISDETEAPMPPIPSIPRHLQNPNIVTLESILSECPLLTEDILRKTPDNQFIAFWSEIAVFHVTGPVLAENTTWHDAEFSYFEVRNTSDPKGPIVGKTDWCTRGDGNDAICQAGEGKFAFILLATNAAPGSAPEKVVLQVFRRGGVAYRICVARIQENQWMKARPKRQLVILG